MTEQTNTSTVRMLVVDDDAVFRERLVKALSARGIEACGAASAVEAKELFRKARPHRVVVDMRMPGETGLELLREWSDIEPPVQTVMLTGYGSIATAVEAVRRGAVDYLTKPADADQILAAFERLDDPDTLPPGALDASPSLARVEWEHIQRTLTDCGGNISEAARKLAIHRRSLQRKLAKLPPLE